MWEQATVEALCMDSELTAHKAYDYREQTTRRIEAFALLL